MIAALVGSITFFAIAILYILLAAGLPYGDFAMGGKYKVMPKQLRMACAISVFIQLVAIMFILQAGKVISVDALKPFATGVCYFFACYLLVNTMMNVLSKSKRKSLS